MLIEPPLISRSVYAENKEEHEAVLSMAQKAMARRRDTWSSRADAAAYLASRFPWQTWDARVREAYVVRLPSPHRPRPFTPR